jgi:hypothetical protein
LGLKGPKAPLDRQVPKVFRVKLELLVLQDHKVQLLLKGKQVNKGQQVRVDIMVTPVPPVRQDLLDRMGNKARKDLMDQLETKVPQGHQVLKVLKEILDQMEKQVKLAKLGNKEIPES